MAFLLSLSLSLSVSLILSPPPPPHTSPPNPLPPPSPPPSGTNNDLGTACGKLYQVSCLTIIDAGDSDIIKATQDTA